MPIIIRSNGDELLRNANINDLEVPKIGVFSDFLAISAA